MTFGNYHGVDEGSHRNDGASKFSGTSAQAGWRTPWEAR